MSSIVDSRRRTYNTLFMLMSIDGKISTGIGKRDIDSDSKYVESLRNGRYQYEDLEQSTDLTSFNTGLVMAKVGWNEEKELISKIPVDFVIVDNEPHLTVRGVSNLLEHVGNLYLVTTNSKHPAFDISDTNLEVIFFEKDIDFEELFSKLKNVGIDKITIQSGGTMNSVLVREGLIDELNLVIAPIMIGGDQTPTLLDGLSLENEEDLELIKEFEAMDAKVLEESFIHLRYKRREEK